MLYKYCNPERVDVLEECRIRFTPPAEFNDPFELVPDLSFVGSPEFAAALESRNRCHAQIDSALYAAKRGLKGRWNEAKYLRNTEGNLSNVREKFRAGMLKKANETRETIRVLCFSEREPVSPEAILLWSHYTHGNKGFVLGFAKDHPWVEAHAPKQKPTMTDCGPVKYNEHRLKIEFGPKSIIAEASEVLFRKSKHWEYEKEYRLVRAKGHPDLDSRKCDSLVDFPPDLVQTIYLGINADSTLTERLEAVLRRECFRHVKKYRMILDPERFCFVPAPWIIASQ